jgi:NADH-quinone oxidoreductase subunit K
MTPEVERYLAVGAVLFVLGALGFITRRNLIVMMLSAELMLNGVSLTLVTFARTHHSLEGQMFTIFILTVAACEAGLALALILALYQKSKSLDIDFWSQLREPGLPAKLLAEEDDGRFVPPAPQQFPRLTPAGVVPDVEQELSSRRVDDVASPTAETPLDPPPARDLIESVKK